MEDNFPDPIEALKLRLRAVKRELEDWYSKPLWMMTGRESGDMDSLNNESAALEKEIKKEIRIKQAVDGISTDWHMEESPHGNNSTGISPRARIIRALIVSKTDFADPEKVNRLCVALDAAGIPIPPTKKRRPGFSEPTKWSEISPRPQSFDYKRLFVSKKSTLLKDLYWHFRK